MRRQPHPTVFWKHTVVKQLYCYQCKPSFLLSFLRNVCLISRRYFYWHSFRNTWEEFKNILIILLKQLQYYTELLSFLNFPKNVSRLLPSQYNSFATLSIKKIDTNNAAFVGYKLLFSLFWINYAWTKNLLLSLTKEKCFLFPVLYINQEGVRSKGWTRYYQLNIPFS